jgi:hypothetical protein
MSQCKKSRDLFDEAYLNELNKEQKLFLETHLRDCAKCRSEFDETTSMLNLMSKKVRVEPEPAFWDGYWARLRERMEKEEVLHPKIETKRKTFFPSLNLIPRWAFQAVTAVVLVVLGIFIGREVFPPSGTVAKIQKDQPPLIDSKRGPGPELFLRTRNFIERSKVILLAIANFDPETEDPFVLNLPYQQEVSKELVQQASWIKKELTGLRQRRLRELITDLEVILLQVANLESEPDLSTIELVKNGVKIRGVLFKIQLTDIRRSISKTNKSKII